MKAAPSVPVRITAKRYKLLKAAAKEGGHTISWLLNYAIDLYFQDSVNAVVASKIAAESKEQAGEAVSA